jgi:hypothetical protein
VVVVEEGVITARVNVVMEERSVYTSTHGSAGEAEAWRAPPLPLAPFECRIWGEKRRVRRRAMRAVARCCSSGCVWFSLCVCGRCGTQSHLAHTHTERVPHATRIMCEVCK